MYVSFYMYLIACILICDDWFHTVFLRQSSCRKIDFGEIEEIQKI